MTSNENDLFQWIIDVYGNCIAYLQRCDIFLENNVQTNNFRRYDDWDTSWEEDPTLPRGRTSKALSEALKLTYVFRQYYEAGRKDRDMLTVGFAPWRWSEPKNFKPCFYVTRCSLEPEGTNSNDVYWIGAMPIWESGNVVDGQVRSFASTSGSLLDEKRHEFQKRVAGNRMSGTAVPLFKISSMNDIEEYLLKVLLDKQM